MKLFSLMILSISAVLQVAVAKAEDQGVTCVKPVDTYERALYCSLWHSSQMGMETPQDAQIVAKRKQDKWIVKQSSKHNNWQIVIDQSGQLVTSK